MLQQELAALAGRDPLAPHVALRVRIAALGIKQYEVAKRAGLSEPVLSKILTGRKEATPEQLAAITQALDEAAA